jgi:hypothetical protein
MILLNSQRQCIYMHRGRRRRVAAAAVAVEEEEEEVSLRLLGVHIEHIRKHCR